MADGLPSRLAEVLNQHEKELLADWISAQKKDRSYRPDLIKDHELLEQCREFLHLLRLGLENGPFDDIDVLAWAEMKNLLTSVSHSRGRQGFTPSATASFIFSFKQPLFERLRHQLAHEPQQFVDETWRANVLLDKLGLFTTEVHQKGRESIIDRQHEEMVELSTPVVKLWEGILALPLIGTLDSGRTQTVMETLLERIVETGSELAIIDITGVPIVDTLTAQHLLKTVAAARLMGADCIISGIRPQIAQTIVHLGVDLSAVATKASLADALKLALKRSGFTIVRIDSTRGG